MGLGDKKSLLLNDGGGFDLCYTADKEPAGPLPVNSSK